MSLCHTVGLSGVTLLLPANATSALLGEYHASQWWSAVIIADGNDEIMIHMIGSGFVLWISYLYQGTFRAKRDKRSQN